MQRQLVESSCEARSPSSPRPPGHSLDKLCIDVLLAAHSGCIQKLNSALNGCHDEYREAAINFRSEVGGETVTPLIVAAREGHLAIVRALVSDFGVDPEQSGTVVVDDCPVSDASALWCASAWGRFNVVKFLVEAGAAVDRACATGSTPLRASCYVGNLDIVQYLLSKGANVNAVNECGNSCLMLCAYRGHVDIARRLVEHGADVNHSYACGTTALHLAAEEGHPEIVRILMARDARVTKNCHGMTPLMAAASNAKVDVVDLLVSDEGCSSDDRVIAYELLACSFANDPDHSNLSMSYHYMYAAMLERDGRALQKAPADALEDYNFQKECCSAKELEQIKSDEEKLCVEALLTLERILGHDHLAVCQHLEYRAWALAELGKYESSVRLLLRAVDAKLRNELYVHDELWQVVKTLVAMLQASMPIPWTLLKRAADLLCRDIDGARIRKDELSVKAQESDMLTMLYLAAVASKCQLSRVETYDLRCAFYRFYKKDVRLSTGCSLLHMAVSQQTYVAVETSDLISFPNSEVTKWLLASGHSVNCQDSMGNTPLHLVVQYANPVNGFKTLHDIIMMIAEYIGHLDCANAAGQTAVQCCATGVAEVILRLQIRPTLKCLAARAVRKGALGYEDVLPQELIQFVQMH